MQSQGEKPYGSKQADGVNGNVENSKSDAIEPTSSGSDDQPIKDSEQQTSPSPDQKPTEKKPSKLKQAWDKLGLDL